MSEKIAYWPVALDLTRLAAGGCVVVGGGEEAEFKVEILTSLGVAPLVVSPRVTPGLERMESAGDVEIRLEEYAVAVVAGVGLVVAATDDEELNRRIAADARRVGAMVNVVDDASESDFIAMALARAGDITVAVSTAGRSPAFASALRDRIQNLLDTGFAEHLEYFAAVRELLLGITEDFRQRVRIWRELTAASLLEVLERDGREAAREVVRGVVSKHVEVSAAELDGLSGAGQDE